MSPLAPPAPTAQSRSADTTAALRARATTTRVFPKLAGLDTMIYDYVRYTFCHSFEHFLNKGMESGTPGLLEMRGGSILYALMALELEMEERMRVTSAGLLDEC